MKRAIPLAAVAAVVAACGGAYLTAPPGSTLTLVANPERIASHGGAAELMAIVTESVGTDVPDGTVVLWSTTLGRVDRETRTVRGIARNRLVSDSRSGTATVTAQSGSDSIPPTTSPTAAPTTTTPSTTTTTTRPASFSALRTVAAGATAGMQNFDQVDIMIGNALVRSITLRANPSRITISNSTHVIATVLDQFGDPVPNVPVFFEVVSNRDFEFFDSAGAPVFTDNNGEAEDVLRTRRTTAGTITVRACASAPGGFLCTPTPLPIPVL
jgi:hypothetical protein